MKSKEATLAINELNQGTLESTIDVINAIDFKGVFESQMIELIIKREDYTYIFIIPGSSKYRILVTINNSTSSRVEMVEIVTGSLVYFQAYSDNISLKELEKILSFKPTKSRIKRFNDVERVILEVSISDELSGYTLDKVDTLLSYLNDFKGEIIELAKKTTSTFKIVEWRYHQDSSGINLKSHQLKSISELGLNMDFHSYNEI